MPSRNSAASLADAPMLKSIRATVQTGIGCRATIYRLIARGELKAIKVGASRRITVESIHRLLNAPGAQ